MRPEYSGRKPTTDGYESIEHEKRVRTIDRVFVSIKEIGSACVGRCEIKLDADRNESERTAFYNESTKKMRFVTDYVEQAESRQWKN